MNERDIQKIIWNWRKHSRVMIPNVQVVWNWYWEMDLAEVSPAYYVTEYEIKRTHSDFMADKKKKYKHGILSESHFGPVKFWYCCPRDIININEVPEYAGLIYDHNIFPNTNKGCCQECIDTYNDNLEFIKYHC